MPTLHWIGKEAVVGHHHTVPFRLLKDEPALGCGDPGSGNLIVEGDNLLALKALLPRYAGKVKCIFIDPPYNTGNEGWVYNDAVNSPAILDWLGKTVGKEAEDLCRHDKWLCMMYPRLALLREFLREDGVIVVTLDDAEVENATHLLNEIFGKTNQQSTVIWQHSVQPKGYSGKMSVHHNYALIYAKSPAFNFKDAPRREEHNVHYSNPDNDPKGPWRAGDVRNALLRPNLIYDLATPSGNIIKPPPKGWRWSKETMADKISTGEVVFRSNETKILRKIYLQNQEGRPPESIWFGADAGTTRDASGELKDIFGGISPFDTPKPSKLIEMVLNFTTGPGDLILDSFAGSGTTGHAVLKLNADNPDKPPRQFIAVEMLPAIARDITAERIRRVATGYTNAKGEAVPGLGGGFRFATLGEELFSASGEIRPEVSFEDLARFVWFTATGEPYPHGEPVPYAPLLGVHGGTAIYLLYNGVLKDLRPAGGNILTRALLAKLPEHAGQKIVYAAGCRLDDESLARAGILFRKTPSVLLTPHV